MFLFYFVKRIMKNCFCNNLRLPVFDFPHIFGISWTLFDNFWKIAVYLCTCMSYLYDKNMTKYRQKFSCLTQYLTELDLIGITLQFVIIIIIIAMNSQSLLCIFSHFEQFQHEQLFLSTYYVTMFCALFFLFI